MTSFIIVGDPHCGKALHLGKNGLGSTLNTRVADQFNLLDHILDRAIENNIENIIFTGDVFEEPKPHPSLITMFIGWLKKCEVDNINVHLILGNHDLIRSGNIFSSSLDIIAEVELQNVNVYKNINTILLGSTAITLMPFRDRKSFSVNSNAEAISLLRESLVYELASIPATYKKVIVGHLAIEGSIPVGDEIDDISNELFCPLDMFEGYDYVWMGHVHKPQIMKKSKPYIAHIGSMDISNFSESDEKKIIIFFDCNSLTNDFTSQVLPTRTLKKINIAIPKDVEDTTQYALQQIKNLALNKAIVKVEISLSAPEMQSVNKSIIEKQLMDLGSFSISSIIESKKVNVIKKDNNSLDTKMDVISAIKIFAETQEHKELFTETAINIYKKYKAEEKV